MATTLHNNLKFWTFVLEEGSLNKAHVNLSMSVEEHEMRSVLKEYNSVGKYAF